MIREATYSDIPRLVGMGRKFHAKAYADLPVGYDEDTVVKLLFRLIDDDDGAVFVSEAGMIGGLIAPFYMDAGARQANELFWWAEDGSGDALLKRFERWAEERSAVVTTLSALEQMRGPAVRRALTRRGYRHHESALVRAT